MKNRRTSLLMAVLLFVGVLATPVFAQSTGSVKGMVKDADGKPIAGATVLWLNLDNGRKYPLKTNKKGEYFSLGFETGKYKATLLVDGKDVFHLDGIHVGLDETDQDINLQKEKEDAAKGIGLTTEQVKERQQAEEKEAKEVGTVKTLNEKLMAAKESIRNADYDTAIATLNDANAMDPNRDVIWGALGEAYDGSASKQTDPAEKTKRLEQAIDDYQKSIDLKKKAMQSNAKPEANAQLAALYNNLARTQANDGKLDDAITNFNQAAQVNPAQAGSYYFNLGAILTNANKTNDPKVRQSAIDAFDKAIAADPNHADAYYYKGTNLVGGATLQGEKMVAPEGTADAFNKYLELQPTGPHAEDAKAMLASIGAPVETSFGKKKVVKK